jgi:hypothetical protein
VNGARATRLVPRPGAPAAEVHWRSRRPNSNRGLLPDDTLVLGEVASIADGGDEALVFDHRRFGRLPLDACRPEHRIAIEEG